MTSEYDLKIEIDNISDAHLDALMGYLKNLEDKTEMNISTLEVKGLTNNE